MELESLDFDPYASFPPELLTTMENYPLNWKPSFFSWRGYEISVMLPSETQYSKGTITQKTGNGFITRLDLVNASSGIPISRSGKVDLLIAYKMRQLIGDRELLSTTSRTAELSLSFLENGLSKEMYLEQMKQRNIEVLSETENSILTNEKRSHWGLSNNILEKTVIVGNIVLKVRTSIIEDNQVDFSTFRNLFENISFTTKV